MFFIQKFTFASEARFERKKKRVCTVGAGQCMRVGGRLKRRLKRNIVGIFVEAGLWSLPVPRYLFICYSSHPSSGKGDERRGGGARPSAHETPALIIFLRPFVFPSLATLTVPRHFARRHWPQIRNAGMRQNFPTRMPYNAHSLSEFFQKFPQIHGAAWYIIRTSVQQQCWCL